MEAAFVWGSICAKNMELQILLAVFQQCISSSDFFFFFLMYQSKKIEYKRKSYLFTILAILTILVKNV